MPERGPIKVPYLGLYPSTINRYCPACEVWQRQGTQPGDLCWSCGGETVTYGMVGYRSMASVNAVTPDLSEPMP